MQEGLLGEAKEICLTDSLDTWYVRARGSSARVFKGTVRRSNGYRRSIAIKFMRPDEIAYAKPMFIKEVAILHALSDVLGVMQMIELGYIAFDNPQDIPPDTADGNGRQLTGKVFRYSPDETKQFLGSFEDCIETGWLPYLGLRRSHHQNNLLVLSDKDLTRGNFFPVKEGLKVAYQACEILEQTHSRNIVYRDHKIIHYYWDAGQQQVTMIDWNAGELYPAGVSESAVHHDLVLFAASALHYIFTGRRHLDAPEVGPTRPEQLENSPDHYEPRWQYSDRKRLSEDVRALLAKALGGAFQTAHELKQDIASLIEE